MPVRKQLAIILLLGTYLFFLGNQAIAITDPVESNYALTASEMLRSGDYLSPRIYGAYWYDKPVFFYWELILAFKLFGINEFAARFFPALFGLVGLVGIYFFARKLYDSKTGFLAALILGTSFEYWLLAKTVITDMTLFVFFNAVLAFFYLAYSSEKKWLYYLCYVFAALAVLTKGPIGLLLPGLIITLFFLWQRRWAELRRMKLIGGTILFLVLGGSWYYQMYLLHGRVFLDTFLGVHNFLRATVSEHPRFDVWYYYAVIFCIGFFPWIFTVPMLLRRYWRERKWPEIDEKTGFLLLWAITIAVFYQCMATKYSTYSFPYLLPIAILAARFLLHHPRIVKRVLAVNLLLYTVLTFWVAIPYCREYSAKDAAAVIAAAQEADGPILSYGNYRTSAVFYSGQMVYRLETADSIEKLKPQGISWNSKNVMPFFSLEKLAGESRALVLVDVDRMERFEQEKLTDLELVQKYRKFYVFQKRKNTP